MPFILDEATSFVEFVHPGISNIWPGEATWTTNNHLLNSALMWLSYQLFGHSEFALRVPNLLAFLVYAWAGFKLMQQLKNRMFRLVFTVGLFAPMYLIDFFAMARGYGLSFAFTLLALALWIETIQNQKKYLWAELSLFLAVLANLSLLYVWPAWWLLSLLRDIFVFKIHFRKVALYRVFSMFLLAIHVVYAMALRKNFTFDLGLQSGLVTAAKSHLSILFFGLESLAHLFYLVFCVAAVVGFILLRPKLENATKFLLGLAVLTFSTHIFGNVLAQLPLPSGRISLHLYLLWFPAFVFLADDFSKKMRWILFVPLVGFVVLSMIDFGKNLNIHQHKDFLWAREQMNAALIARIKSNPELAYNAPFYYKSNAKYESIKSADFPYISTYNFPSPQAGAYLFSADEAESLAPRISARQQFGSLFFAKNLHPPSKKEIAQGDTVLTFVAQRDMKIIKTWLPEAPSYFVTVDVGVQNSSGLNPILLCLQTSDSAGTAIVWEAVELHHYVDKFDGSTKKYYFFVDTLSPKTAKIDLYFWNLRMRKIDNITASYKVFESKIEQ